MLICGNKLGVYPQLVLVGAGGELGTLIVEPAAYSRGGVAQELLQIGRALARAVYPVALAVKLVKELRKALVFFECICRTVLAYILEREVERLTRLILQHSRLAGIGGKPLFYALECGAHALALRFVGAARLDISPARLRYLAAYERRRAFDAREQRGREQL